MEKAPSYYTYYVTFRCNLKCPMCYQRPLQDRAYRELSAAEAIALFDRIDSLERVNLIGGEIFVRKDIWEILQYFDNRGVKTYITTHGMLLDADRIERLLIMQHLLGISVSLDGLDETFQDIRGKTADSTKVLDVVRALSPHMEVRVNSVLQPMNIHSFETLIDSISAAGAKMLKLAFYINHPQRVVNKTEELMKAWHGKPISCLYPVSEPIYQLEDLQQTVNAVQQYCQQRGLRLQNYPDAILPFLKEWVDETLWQQYQLDCEMFNAIPRMKVMPNGDVILCEGLDLILGNLLEKTPDEIWNSPAKTRFRQQLKTHGGLPICQHCPKIVIGARRPVEISLSKE